MDWIKNNFKQAILIALLTVVLSTVGSIVVYSFTKHEDQLDKSASVEYVDKKCEDTRTYIDKQNILQDERMTRIQTDVNKKADKDDFDKLYDLALQTNRIVIEIAREKGLKVEPK